MLVFNMSVDTKKKEDEIFIPGPAGQLQAYLSGFPVERLSNPLPQGEVLQGPDKLEHNQVYFSESSTKCPTIGIICHPHPLYQGAMDNKVVTTIHKAWREMGLATIRFNFRGVGLSTGEYADGVGELEDLRAVIQWGRTHYPSAELWLAGFSFGAFISVGIASLKEYPISALLSVALPLRLFSLSPEVSLDPPWIIIQGDQDELQGYQEVCSWVEQIKKRKLNVSFITLAGATHFFHGRLIELKNEIMIAMKPLMQTRSER